MTAMVSFLLAQNPVADGLKGLRGGLNSPETVGADLNLFFWLLMALALFLATLLVVNRRRQRRALNLATVNPSRFFGRALRNLRVGRKDRMVIDWLARRAGLERPTAMLLHPAVFDAYAGRITGSIDSKSLREYATGRLAIIRSLAFEARDDGEKS